VSLAGQLEVAAQAVTAVLCVWLGLTVAIRSRSSAAGSFARLALTLAVWSSSIVVQRLSTSPEVVGVGRAIEEVAAAIAIAATMHFALVIATDGRPGPRQRATVLVFYPVLLAFALPGIVDPTRPISFAEPHVSIGPVPGVVLAWAWVVARVAALGVAAGWLIAARRGPGVGPFRRRQLGAALATVVAGGIGAGLRFLPVVGEADAWIGVSFVTLAVVLATYAVFAAGIFFGQAVADHAFRTSLAGAGAVLLLVAATVVIDRASWAWLGLEVPFFTALVLVVAIAVYEPVSNLIRSAVGGGGARAAARDRLLRALGQPTLGSLPAEAGVGPALSRLAAALDLSGLTVVGTEGAAIASVGTPVGAGSVPPVPLRAGAHVLGELRVGQAANGAALTARDEELVHLSAAYVAAALLTGRREDEQISQLTQLAQERADVESRA
jgi:hypothetical protein